MISHEKFGISYIFVKSKNVTFATFYTSDLMTGPLGQILLNTFRHQRNGESAFNTKYSLRLILYF